MITIPQLNRELRAMLRKGGLAPDYAGLSLWSIEREPVGVSRSFAELDLDAVFDWSTRRMVAHEPAFYFSRRTFMLDAAHREGLIAHEVGHALAALHWGDTSEAAADRAACEFLDVDIAYDRSWPGKGLQFARGGCPRRNPEDALALYRRLVR